MDDPSWLQIALGYLDLKMFEETWQALDELPTERQGALPVLELRVACLLDQGRFGEAFEWCRKMCLAFPDEHTGYIQGAFCLHELERTEEARQWLQSGPHSLQLEAKYFYNLGCYDLALGREESAGAWLIQAFEMEPSYRDDALKDPDFRPILKKIEAINKEEDGFPD